MKKNNRMTAGTGTTGQMRHEMNKHNEKKLTKKDVMTGREARNIVGYALRNNKLITEITPDEAEKI